MIKTEEVYKIGRLGKPHGVKGEISFQFADDIFDRTDCDYLVLELDGIFVPFFIEEYRFRTDDTAIVKFCDIDTQERAAELTGCNVFFPRHIAKSDDEGLSWAAIIGYIVSDARRSVAVGRIVAVDDSTINTLFELEDGTLIPASEDLIEDVDASARTITMNLPEGILDVEGSSGSPEGE